MRWKHSWASVAEERGLGWVVHIAGAGRVTVEINGDGDVCSFLDCWESCTQGEGLADTASGGHMTPMVALGRQLWAPTQCPGEGVDELLAGPRPCWGGWGGGSIACLQKDMCMRASPQGDSCRHFCPWNLSSERTGSITPHFNEQSMSRDQEEFFRETECRGKDSGGMRQSS